MRLYFCATNLRYIILSAVTAIDTSGIELIRELRKLLDKRSLQVRNQNSIIYPDGFVEDIVLIIFGVHMTFLVGLGKSCWKCDGKAATIKSFGIVWVEWTVSNSWRSSSRHFISVEGSAMTWCRRHW